MLRKEYRKTEIGKVGCIASLNLVEFLFSANGNMLENIKSLGRKKLYRGLYISCISLKTFTPNILV